MKKQSKSFTKQNIIIIFLIFLIIFILFNNLNPTGRTTQEDCYCTIADINKDTILDVNDLNIIADCINNKETCNQTIADINQDNTVNELDLSIYNKCHRKEIPLTCYKETQPMQEITQVNITETQVTYIYANNQRIAKKNDDGIFYYHNDHLGSPRAITDSEGTTIQKIDYKPFGQELTTTSSKIQYNSKELDKDTELHYYGARYYSSPIGRFLTADTIKGSLTDPQSLNLYVYVKNNPMKYIDPMGEQIEYLSEESKEQYQYLEEDIYKGMSKDKKHTYIIGSIEEVVAKQSEEEQVMFMMRFLSTGGLAMPGTLLNEEILPGVRKDATYIFLAKNKDISEENFFRIAVHEGFHARHFAENILKNPTDITGYMRYSDLSQKANQMIEEMITGAQTIDFLEKRGFDSSFIDEKERKYFDSNYANYYYSLYNSYDNLPYGEKEMLQKDKYFKHNQFVENLYRKYGVYREK